MNAVRTRWSPYPLRASIVSVCALTGNAVVFHRRFIWFRRAGRCVHDRRPRSIAIYL